MIPAIIKPRKLIIPRSKILSWLNATPSHANSTTQFSTLPLNLKLIAEPFDSPSSSPAPFTFEEEVQQLQQFIEKSSYLLAITGAGVSTDSGIPDYRGRNGSYRKGHKPITHSDFLQQEHKRKRYWARSMVGWHRVSHATPNDAHYSLAQLEAKGKLQYLITQNVDRLHQRAGSINVMDLHGRIDHVKCMNCHLRISRRIIQDQLIGLNRPWNEFIQSRLSALPDQEEKLRADGDADLELDDYSQFTLPCCNNCGGMLKPDVVFFGDNVPAENVQFIYDKVDKCDGLLVVGTSLEVFSAYRFVNRANKNNVPIAIINDGVTRAERQQLSMIQFKSNQNCAKLLKTVVNRMYPVKFKERQCEL